MLIQKQYAVIIPNTPLPAGNYYPSDVNEVDAQLGAINVVEVTIRFPAQSQQFTTAAIGIDANGNLLDQDDHLLALPCPPYCMLRMPQGNEPQPI
jgi:hypothetical protein